MAKDLSTDRRQQLFRLRIPPELPFPAAELGHWQELLALADQQLEPLLARGEQDTAWLRLLSLEAAEEPAALRSWLPRLRSGDPSLFAVSLALAPGEAPSRSLLLLGEAADAPRLRLPEGGATADLQPWFASLFAALGQRLLATESAGSGNAAAASPQDSPPPAPAAPEALARPIDLGPYRLLASPALPVDQLPLWEAARERASGLLQVLGARRDGLALLEAIFAPAGGGDEAFRGRARSLLRQLGDGTLAVDVEWLHDSVLQGVNAASIGGGDRGRDRIVLNADRLAAGLFDLDGLTEVLLEELGHGLDRQLNGDLDSPGDEGRLFAAAVMGETLSDDAQAVIGAEDDRVLLNLAGTPVWAEASAVAFSPTAGTYGGSSASASMSYSVTLDATNNNGADLLVALYSDVAATSSLIGWQVVNRRNSFAANAVYSGIFNFSAANLTRVDTSAIGVRIWEGTAGTAYGTASDSAPAITYGNTNIAAGSSTGFRPNTTSSPDKNSSVTFTGTPTAAGGNTGFSTSSGSVSVRTTLPILSSQFPTLGATGVQINNSIVLTFSEAVVGAGGTIGIQTGSSSTNTFAMTLTAGSTSGSFSTGSGSWRTQGTQLFITPASGLSSNTTYNVDIGSTALRDVDGNVYAGFTSTNTSGIYFTTGPTLDSTAPTLTVGSPLATLEEAGGVNNAVAGTASTSLSISRSDTGGGTFFDSAYLLANGWTTSNNGVSYVKSGSYGTATLTTATGVVSYALNNAAPATEALKPADLVSDGFAAVRVLDYANNGTTSSAISFQIQGANDAPSLNPADSPILTTIQAGLAAPSNGSTANSTLVGTLLSGLSDPDSSSLGLAIKGVNSSIGTLYYSIDNGSSWATVGSASDSNLLLLGSGDRLYLQPAAGGTGSFADAFSFYGWDRSVGTTGSRVALSTTTTASDSFASQAYSGGLGWLGNWTETNDDSSATASDIQVVNTLNAFSLRFSETGNTLTPIISRSIDLSGATSAQLSFNYQRRNLNSNHPIGVQASKDGSTWSSDLLTIVGTGTNDSTWQAANVDLTSYISATTAIRFVVSTALGGSNYLYVDDVVVTGTTIGSIVGALSSVSDSVAITIKPPQNAPVLDPAPLISLALPAEAPAPTGAVGFLVADLLVGASDLDTGDSLGIALIGADQSNGSWFFSTNGGSSWSAVGSLSASSARLLAGDALSRLYYRPNAGYNGDTAQLTFRAWDQTSGSAGSLADTSVNGGNTAFSAATDTVSTRITAGGVQLLGSSSGDRLLGGPNADLLNGSTGADSLSGAEGRDGFFNPTGASSVVISGSGNAGTISGFDVVTDFRLADGSTSGDGFAESEWLRVTPSGSSAVIATAGLAGGTASSLTIAGATVKSRSIGSGLTSGIVQFDDAATYATALTLASSADVAAAVQYLAANSLGDAGSTVAFVTASFSGGGFTGVRTYVYTQTAASAGSSGGFGLVELRGVTATSLTTSASTTTAGALLISNGLPPTASLNAVFNGSEDTALNLVVSGNSQPLFADSDSSGSLTVTLTPTSGTISTSAGSGISLGGSPAAPTIAGTAAALDTYFRSSGALVYTPLANANGSVSLAVSISDGTASNSYSSSIVLAAVQDPPLINDATASILKTATLGSPVIDLNDANTGTDVDVDADPITYTISSDSSGGGFAVQAATGLLSLADPSKINFSGAPASFQVVVRGSDGSLSDTATITIAVQATNLLGTANADILTGSAADNYLSGLAGADNISGLDGQDLLQGGVDADTLSGGNGSDSFYIPTGDNTVTLAESGDSGSLSGFDVITDYTPANGSTTAEQLRVTPIGADASILTNGTAAGSPSTLTIASNTIKSRSVSSGIASFDTAAPWSQAITLGSAANVAAVVDYLRNNNLGAAGSVLAFRTAAYNDGGYNGVRSFIYTQTAASAGNVGGFSLIELRGISAAALTTTLGETAPDTVFISNNLPPIGDVSGGFVVSEDINGNLLFGDTPFTDLDTTGSSPTGVITVTLSVPTGTINGSASGSISIGGSATARSFSGTVANLNAYFTTAGAITYLGASNANGSVPLSVTISDGQASNNRTYTSSIQITAVNDAPTLTAAPASTTLIEAGGTNNATAGVATAQIQFSKADVDSSVVYDTAYLISNGWSSSDAGLTYGKSGTYGTATLTLATGGLSYQLDDARVATDSLSQNQSVQDAFSIQVTDGQFTASATGSFSISGRNDAPTVTSAGTLTVAENSAGSVYSATASDPDSSNLTFTLAGADVSLFNLSSAGVLSFKTAPDYEIPTDSGSNNVYDLEIIATDGNLTGSRALAITISDVNEAPTAVNLSNAVTSLADDTSTASPVKLADIVISDDALGSNTISLSGADASSFTVISGGLYLQAGVALNVAVKSRYDVTVSVQDNSLPGSTPVTKAYSLTIINQTPPTVQSVALTSASGAQNGVLNAGDTVFASVTMSEPVVVAGAPSLNLSIGTDTLAASYDAGLSSSSVLVFSTTISAGQTASTGIAIPANGLINSSGGSIKDLYNNTGILSFAAVAANPAYRVDTTAPAAPVLSLASGLAAPLTKEQLTQGSGSIAVVAENGSTVVLTATSSGGGSFQRSFIGSGADQRLVVTDAEASQLADGSISVTASCSDPAGNISVDATPLDFDYLANPATLLGQISVTLLQNGAETGPLPTRFQVTRTGSTAAAATIRYTLSGSAKVDADYTYATGSGYSSQGYGNLTFAAGSDTAIVELPTVDNTTSDSSRTLSIQLQSSPQYDVSVEVATAQLVDNEVSVPIPLVTIAPASFSEGDIGDNTEGSVVVTLDRSTTVQVNVNYSFRSGTAILGNDFSATSGTLVFAPSVRQLTIPFTVIGDVTVEPDESFYVDLTIPDSQAAFAGAVNTIAGTVEILNDDPNIGINKTGSGSISGTARNDTLTGSSAIDTILAGAGNDRLEGKGEADILIGGLGADSFVYNNFSDSTLSAFDSINDFNPDPSEGDRIGVASLPSKLWSSGVISASTLADAMAGAFANPDGDSNTSDVLAQGDAVIFSYNPLPWLTFNYLAVKGGSGDLVVSLEGYNPGTAGSLVVSNFFTSSSTP